MLTDHLQKLQRPLPLQAPGGDLLSKRMGNSFAPLHATWPKGCQRILNGTGTSCTCSQETRIRGRLPNTPAKPLQEAAAMALSVPARGLAVRSIPGGCLSILNPPST